MHRLIRIFCWGGIVREESSKFFVATLLSTSTAVYNTWRGWWQSSHLTSPETWTRTQRNSQHRDRERCGLLFSLHLWKQTWNLLNIINTAKNINKWTKKTGFHKIRNDSWSSKFNHQLLFRTFYVYRKMSPYINTVYEKWPFSGTPDIFILANCVPPGRMQYMQLIFFSM